MYSCLYLYFVNSRSFHFGLSSHAAGYHLQTCLAFCCCLVSVLIPGPSVWGGLPWCLLHPFQRAALPTRLSRGHVALSGTSSFSFSSQYGKSVSTKNRNISLHWFPFLHIMCTPRCPTGQSESYLPVNCTALLPSA